MARNGSEEGSPTEEETSVQSAVSRIVECVTDATGDRRDPEVVLNDWIEMLFYRMADKQDTNCVDVAAKYSQRDDLQHLIAATDTIRSSSWQFDTDILRRVFDEIVDEQRLEDHSCDWGVTHDEEELVVVKDRCLTGCCLLKAAENNDNDVTLFGVEPREEFARCAAVNLTLHNTEGMIVWGDGTDEEEINSAWKVRSTPVRGTIKHVTNEFDYDDL